MGHKTILSFPVHFPLPGRQRNAVHLPESE
jgi:hypothetical protein